MTLWYYSTLNHPVPGNVLFDKTLFKEPFFQRVYQYLRRHKGGQNLDSFHFAGSVEGNTSDCLKMILKYVNVPILRQLVVSLPY